MQLEGRTEDPIEVTLQLDGEVEEPWEWYRFLALDLTVTSDLLADPDAPPTSVAKVTLRHAPPENVLVAGALLSKETEVWSARIATVKNAEYGFFEYACVDAGDGARPLECTEGKQNGEPQLLVRQPLPADYTDIPVWDYSMSARRRDDA